MLQKRKILTLAFGNTLCKIACSTFANSIRDPLRGALKPEVLLHLCLTLPLTQSRETTVCGLSSSQHQNQLDFEQKAIYLA